jgi:hypothetical protein
VQKEETNESLEQLGQRVVKQEGRVTRLELVRPPAGASSSFTADEQPTRPGGGPPRPPIPRYPRRP